MMVETPGLVVGSRGLPSCWWHSGIPEYEAYHDKEWGRPDGDDTRIFENLVLDGFQAGLSWLTILRKRDAFRVAFAGFDIDRVAGFGSADVDRLLEDSGIVRHRGKIAAAVQNASQARLLRDEFGSLAAYFWSYEPPPDTRPPEITLATLEQLTTSPESQALSKDLKRRGWSFVGPTIIYAFMQATGIVNDHIGGCWCRDSVESERRAFERPSNRG